MVAGKIIANSAYLMVTTQLLHFVLGCNSNFLSSAFQLSITKEMFEIASFLEEFVCLFVDSQTMPFVLHPP